MSQVVLPSSQSVLPDSTQAAVAQTSTAQSTSGSKLPNEFSPAGGVLQEELAGPKNAPRMLPQHGANIAIDSVAYLKSDDPNESPNATWVAVSIKLTFGTQKKFEAASVSFSVEPCNGTSTGLSRRRAKLSLFKRLWNILFPKVQKQHTKSSGTLGVRFIYPNNQERVTVGTEVHQRDTTGTLNPKLAVFGPVNANLELGSYSTRDAYASIPHISRVGSQTNVLPEGKLCIHWEFRNHHATFYPASHTLIILMRGDSGCTDTPPFTFKIRIDRLDVKNYAPLKSGDDSWEFTVNGNYDPERVSRILRAHKDGNAGISLADLAAHIGTA